MIVEVFDMIELLDKLETVKENKLFINLEFNKYEIEKKNPVSYISNNLEDEDNLSNSDSHNNCDKVLYT
jgi:hypothetical protein